MKHNWEYKRLGDICDKGSSNLMQKNLEIIDEGFEVFGASGSLGKIDFYQQAEPYVGIVKDGSGVGRCNLYPAKSSLLGTMQYILAKKYVTNAYLCYLLQSLNLSKYVNGTAIPHIYFRDYKNEIVPVPPMEVQELIVAELDKINEVIEDCRELLRNLDALAQSLFYDYFGDIYHNPKRWISTTLGDVAEKISNGANTKIELDTYKNNGIVFFRCQNVWRNRLDMSDIVFVDEGTNAKMKSSILKHNDLLVTKIGRLFTENSSLGRVALYEGEDGAANLSGNLSFIRLKPIVAPKFILYILISDYFRDYVRNTTSGGIDKRALNNSQLKALPIYLPPLELQEKFAERIEQIEAQKNAVEETIANLQTLLDSRMEYWFN